MALAQPSTPRRRRKSRPQSLSLAPAPASPPTSDSELHADENCLMIEDDEDGGRTRRTSHVPTPPRSLSRSTRSSRSPESIGRDIDNGDGTSGIPSGNPGGGNSIGTRGGARGGGVNYCYCSRCVPMTPMRHAHSTLGANRTSGGNGGGGAIGAAYGPDGRPAYDLGYDPRDINPPAPLDPDDATWTATVLYAVVYGMTFFVRWSTVLSGLATAAALGWAAWTLDTWTWQAASAAGAPWWSVAVVALAVLELVLSLVLVVPHRRMLERRFADSINRYPTFPAETRWGALTEAIDAFHPYPGPIVTSEDGDRPTSRRSTSPTPTTATSPTHILPRSMPMSIAASDAATAVLSTMTPTPVIDARSHRTMLRASRPLPSAAGQPYHVVPHVGTFLSGWFFGANPCEIKEDNVMEWLAWAFFNRHADEMDERSPEAQECRDMVQYVQDRTGVLLEKGYNPKAKCIRLNLDSKRIKWRGGIFYAIMTLVNLAIPVLLSLLGYTHHASADGTALLHIPSCLTKRSKKQQSSSTVQPPSNASGSSTTTRRRRGAKNQQPQPQEEEVQEQKQQNESEKPILILHGLGVGMTPYLTFALYMWWTTGRPVAFLHIPAVSIRLFPPPPPSPESLNAFVRSVWHDQLHLPTATLLGHSLGTSIASWLVKDPDTTRDVADSAVLVDPVCFGLCFFDVAYNFVYKTPRTWTQLFIRFFAGRDPNVASYLYRGFWWFENILYPTQWGRTMNPPGAADRGDARLEIFLSEYDSIVNSEAVHRYLERTGAAKATTMFPGYGHGGFLYHPREGWGSVRAALGRVARNAGAVREGRDEEVCLRSE
ncbi:hypothetical protein BC828DRAFT_88051 [Blastocladiella britannica]|nr:hypothetical protein BC828DRAFT_88051 [Blastocladiella britannica]